MYIYFFISMLCSILFTCIFFSGKTRSKSFIKTRVSFRTYRSVISSSMGFSIEFPSSVLYGKMANFTTNRKSRFSRNEIFGYTYFAVIPRIIIQEPLGINVQTLTVKIIAIFPNYILYDLKLTNLMRSIFNVLLLVL